MGGVLYFQKPLNAKDGVRGAHRDVYYWRVSENLERNPKMSVFASGWFPVSTRGQRLRLMLQTLLCPLIRIRNRAW